MKLDLSLKGFNTDLTVQIACIAESVRLQQMLANYGIHAQTPKQIDPIEIWPPSELVKAYDNLGQNTKLKLTGYVHVLNMSSFLSLYHKDNSLFFNPKTPESTCRIVEHLKIISNRLTDCSLLST